MVLEELQSYENMHTERSFCKRDRDTKYHVCSHKYVTKIRPFRLKGVKSLFPLPFECYNAATIPSAPHPDKD